MGSVEGGKANTGSAVKAGVGLVVNINVHDLIKAQLEDSGLVVEVL